MAGGRRRRLNAYTAEGLVLILVVGLIFAGVIALGQFTHWIRHRRH
jgi:hypothetical protein